MCSLAESKAIVYDAKSYYFFLASFLEATAVTYDALSLNNPVAVVFASLTSF